MKRLHAVAGYMMLLIILLTGLIGCEGSDNGGILAPLSEDNVNETLEWAEQTIPGCRLTGTAAMPTSAALMQAAINESNISSQIDADAPPFQRILGNCPGSPGELTITRLQGHADGLKEGLQRATYVFDNLCIIDESLGIPQEVTINGIFIEQTEKDSDDPDAPVHRQTARTDGKIKVTSPDETIWIALNDYNLAYGSPGETPSRNHPDELTIKTLSFEFQKENTKHSLRNIRADIYEEGDSRVIDIFQGRYYIGSRPYLKLFTDPPLLFNKTSENLTGGALVFSGARGARATVAPSAQSAAVFEFKFNGKPLDRNLDCTDFDMPILNILTDLL